MISYHLHFKSMCFDDGACMPNRIIAHNSVFFPRVNHCAFLGNMPFAAVLKKRKSRRPDGQIVLQSNPHNLPAFAPQLNNATF